MYSTKVEGKNIGCIDKGLIIFFFGFCCFFLVLFKHKMQAQPWQCKGIEFQYS